MQFIKQIKKKKTQKQQTQQQNKKNPQRSNIDERCWQLETVISPSAWIQML